MCAEEALAELVAPEHAIVCGMGFQPMRDAKNTARMAVPR